MSSKRFKIIYLELTNACNFKCDYCPIDQQTRLKEMMPTELARRIIDEIADNDLTEFLTFHIMGEPYLHKQVVELAGHAEARGLRLRLLTNGSLLSRAKNEALFNVGLSRLEIGFRTPNESSFAMRLRGGSVTLEQYIRRTEELIDDKLRLNASTELCIKLFIRSHAAALKMADPYEHLTSEDDNARLAREFQRFTLETARKYGHDTRAWEQVPMVTVDGEYPIFPGINIGFSRIQDFWVREQRGENLTPLHVRGGGNGDGGRGHEGTKARRHEGNGDGEGITIGTRDGDGDGIATGKTSGEGNGNGSPRRYYKACIGGCSAGFRDNFGILVTGEVTTCCVDYDARNVVGDLRKQSLMEVLESAQAKQIKRSLEWLVPPTDFCKECLGGPTLASSVVKQVSTAVMDLRDRISRRQRYAHLSRGQRHNDLD